MPNIKKKIIIVIDQPFPYGGAATNRIISYAIPLSKINNVIVYIVKPTETSLNPINKNSKGDYHGIKFYYLSGKTYRSERSFIIIRAFEILKTSILLLVNIVKEHPKSIILYCSLVYIRYITLFARFISFSKMIIEENEFPKIFTKNKLIKSIIFHFYRLSDGMIVMTKELKDYYSKLKASNIFILPMTIDHTRFEKLKKEFVANPYFAYCGGWGGLLRDGIFDIIKGFYLFSKTNSTVNLFVIGPFDNRIDNYMEIIYFVNEKNLSERIKFIHTLPSYEVPRYLINAVGLIMAPPKDFSSGGFPIKLGEYLASGNPVICTNVSDIATFLNSTNSFLINPNQPQEICDAMLRIVNNKYESESIGHNGRELSKKVFNAETYLKELNNFL